jgi:hypothetical protein
MKNSKTTESAERGISFPYYEGNITAVAEVLSITFMKGK